MGTLARAPVHACKTRSGPRVVYKSSENLQFDHSSQLAASSILIAAMTRKILFLAVVVGVFGVALGGHSKWVEAKSKWNFKMSPVDKHAVEIKIPQFSHSKDEHGHDKIDTHYVLDWYAEPKYKYDYEVEDKHTGDYKGQKENTDGHEVEGEYSLLEPGGRHRTVKYTAGKDGWHADVEYHGENTHRYAIHDHGNEEHKWR